MKSDVRRQTAGVGFLGSEEPTPGRVSDRSVRRPVRRSQPRIEELRRLTFSMDELATAVLSHLLAMKKMGERDRLSRISLQKGEGVAVDIVIHHRRTDQSEAQCLEGEQLAAALLMHCIKRKVPLPKRAMKSIIRVGDRLALEFSIK